MRLPIRSGARWPKRDSARRTLAGARSASSSACRRSCRVPDSRSLPDQWTATVMRSPICGAVAPDGGGDRYCGATPECRTERGAVFTKADMLRVEVSPTVEVARLRAALEHVIESCEHPSPTIHAYDYIAHVARQALAAAGGQSSPPGCPACSPDPKIARPPHTCSGEQS